VAWGSGTCVPTTFVIVADHESSTAHLFCCGGVRTKAEAASRYRFAIEFAPAINSKGPVKRRGPEGVRRRREHGAGADFDVQPSSCRAHQDAQFAPASYCPRFTDVRNLRAVAAREFDEDFEWTGHEAGARRAGVSGQTIQAIQFNRELKDVPAKDALMIRFGRALFREHKVSPELYAEVVKTFGQRGAVEAAWIMGDYAMAAVALRAVDQHNPDGAQPLTGGSKQ
jgi:hypothetical protein